MLSEIEDAVWTWNAEEILLYVRTEIELESGYAFPASPVDPDGAVQLARVANHDAKWTGRWDLKVLAFAAAAALEGVESGWDGDVFYIAGPVGLPASAHDPYDQLWEALKVICPEKADGHWEPGWDGIPRQWVAWQIAAKLPALRRRLIRRNHKPQGEK